MFFFFGLFVWLFGFVAHTLENLHAHSRPRLFTGHFVARVARTPTRPSRKDCKKNSVERKMPKRGGLMRMVTKPHGPGDAGGYASSIKKKNKVKVKASGTATSAATAAVTSAAAADDLFAMALPTKLSVRASKKKRRDDLAAEPVERVPAFEDEQKQDLFAQVLAAARNAAPVQLIGIDRHRAHMEELKRVKAERNAKKAERFAKHLKC